MQTARRLTIDKLTYLLIQETELTSKIIITIIHHIQLDVPLNLCLFNQSKFMIHNQHNEFT